MSHNKLVTIFIVWVKASHEDNGLLSDKSIKCSIEHPKHNQGGGAN